MFLADVFRREDHDEIENLLTKQLIDYALDMKDEALFKSWL